MLRRPPVPADDARPRAALEVFRVALGLGLTSFGGPVAHLGYFHGEYVERRRWLSEAAYLELVALSQLLPGPASSQVGIGIGLLRAGWVGAVAAWLGFTLPSAVLLTVFALATADLDLAGMGWIHGLKLAAMAIVAAAIVAMWRALAPDWPRRLVALASAAVLLLLSTAALQVAVIAVGGVAGWWLLRGRTAAPQPAGATSPVSGRLGLVLMAAFVVLLVGLPVAAAVTASPSIAVVESFYRAGALVFGGGHVVLPLLSESFVTPGWVDRDTFLAGYGAAQAVPGPLFAVAAHLGASLEPQPNGPIGAVVATVSIFLPSFLLVGAALPLWERLRRSSAVRGALAGASAAVIGLLIAALVDPLWISTVAHPADIGLAAAAFGVLVVLRTPSWAVVIALAVAGQAMAIFGIG